MIVTLGILDFVPRFSLFLLIFWALFTLLIIPQAFIDLDFRLIQQSLFRGANVSSIGWECPPY